MCRGKGGNLLVLETEEEWRLINEAIQQHDNNFDNEWYIGLRKVRGNWTWVNGKPLTFDRWRYKEPNGDGEEVIMSKEYPPGEYGQFNDQNWARKEGFICEYPASA